MLLARGSGFLRNPGHLRTRAGKVVPVALIIFGVLWRLHGGLALACAMWICAFVYMRGLPPRLKGLTVPWFSVLLGMVCNATVVVANDGFMPVVGLRPEVKPLLPSWIAEAPPIISWFSQISARCHTAVLGMFS